ncbi:MAG: hypothetical protein IPK82_31815 [Polyangiaceae bacterium]|nr:hypothetical protein [Polyangiaceae bacterium]
MIAHRGFLLRVLGLLLCLPLGCDGDGETTGNSTSASGGSGGGSSTSTAVGGAPSGGSGGAGGATTTGPNPVTLIAEKCDAFCSQVAACGGEKAACEEGCLAEGEYSSLVGLTCTPAFIGVLECATALSCGALDVHLMSAGMEGECTQEVASYLSEPACSPPAVCDDACAVLVGCDVSLTLNVCRFDCGAHIQLGALTASGACEGYQTDYYTCVAGAACSSLADGSACAAEKEAIADCL